MVTVKLNMQSLKSANSPKIREQIVVNNARYVHNDMCNVQRIARMPFVLAPHPTVAPIGPGECSSLPHNTRQDASQGIGSTGKNSALHRPRQRSSHG